jgi:hypothetical protein
MMNSKLAAVSALVAMVGFGSAALAETNSLTGTIQSINTNIMMVQLSDGYYYVLPQGFNIAEFVVGEQVMVTWAHDGLARDIDTMVAG